MIFCVDHNSVLRGLNNSTFDKAKTVILWNDVGETERSIIKTARSLGKKTLVYQHGRRGTSKYFPPFNEKIFADKLLVWGEQDKKDLIEAGQDPKKIAVVGSTVFKYLKPRVPHKDINIVFCPEHWDRPVKENIQVRDELRKLKNVNVITKIIEGHNPKEFDNSVASRRDNINHLAICIDTLCTADLVVGISESTFELLAQALDIPVVIMEEWEPKAFGGDMRYTEYTRRIISKASKRATMGTLLDTIKQQLENPQELTKERKEVVISEGGWGLDTLKLIKNGCK